MPVRSCWRLLRVTAGGEHGCTSVLDARGGTVVAMPLWQYAQLRITVGSRSPDNKCSRAPCEVVPVPDRQPADRGRY